MGVPIFTASLEMLTALESDGRRMMWCVSTAGGTTRVPSSTLEYMLAGGMAQNHARHLAVQHVPPRSVQHCKACNGRSNIYVQPTDAKL